MFNIHNKTAPSYLCNFEKIQHQYKTKSSEIAYVRPTVSSQGLLTFMYAGITLFNKLPLNIKKIDHKEDFKRKCKDHLMKKAEKFEKCDYIYL